MVYTSLKTPLFAGLGLLAALGLGLPTAPAVAATATTSFAVTATVQATCTAVTATALAFGTYTGVAAAINSTITVTCTNSTPYDIGLSAGLASGATVTTRKMQKLPDLLAYGLFKDAAFTNNWGVTIGTDTVHLIGNGAPQNTTVFGQLPANQFVAPGAYSDTITF